LVAKGGALEVAAVVSGMLIAFESAFGDKWYYWGDTFLAISVASVVVGATLGLRGYAKLKRERRAGYTTALLDARKDRSLFLLHPVTFDVLLRPDQQRPETIMRAIRIRDLLFRGSSTRH